MEKQSYHAGFYCPRAVSPERPVRDLLLENYVVDGLTRGGGGTRGLP